MTTITILTIVIILCIVSMTIAAPTSPALAFASASPSIPSIPSKSRMADTCIASTSTHSSIASIIASLANTPMTLESGISFPMGLGDPATATNILMKNSPFFITMTSNGGIQLTNSKGQWLTRTSPIVDADAFSNGYCYFVTENGHKYNFTIVDSLENETTKASQFNLKKPTPPEVKLYASFWELPRKERDEFADSIGYYYSKYANKYYGVFHAKRSDFGFVGSAFCHISDCVDKVKDLSIYDGAYVMGNCISTKKGHKLQSYTFDDDAIAEMLGKAEQGFLAECNEIITARAGYKYDEQLKNYNQQLEAWDKLGFYAEDISFSVDDRAYFDYKHTTNYKLSRSVSREEFSAFLKIMGQYEKEYTEWYLSYTTVKGDGDKWTYTYVSPSTH